MHDVETMFTPGPWIVRPGVYDTNPETASEFPHGPEVVAGTKTVAYLNLYGEANARLIAAAPRLFAALVAMVEAYKDVCSDEDQPSMVREAMLAIEEAL